ncbi:uncharacterized protein LAESUDRAFT_711837 [Laetiporus sulphureus 93-53]|uniref:Uncharacterized protein n=1 Tax=Laetiporus sulphureus 93-53 TaxID=1314785 RepID=A0A165G917_9APHY|nr:uncharacterized protein LAESUDRAFT_711837 [Laetiporus sulphureus 93-53]KZT10002.1 hypothetical protein LAESUDRAFT_711837 [Laetiporus sulphureus 93-53]
MQTAALKQHSRSSSEPRIGASVKKAPIAGGSATPASARRLSTPVAIARKDGPVSQAQPPPRLSRTASALAKENVPSFARPTKATAARALVAAVQRSPPKPRADAPSSARRPIAATPGLVRRPEVHGKTVPRKVTSVPAPPRPAARRPTVSQVPRLSSLKTSPRREPLKSSSSLEKGGKQDVEAWWTVAPKVNAKVDRQDMDKEDVVEPVSGVLAELKNDAEVNTLDVALAVPEELLDKEHLTDPLVQVDASGTPGYGEPKVEPTTSGKNHFEDSIHSVETTGRLSTVKNTVTTGEEYKVGSAMSGKNHLEDSKRSVEATNVFLHVKNAVVAVDEHTVGSTTSGKNHFEDSKRSVETTNELSNVEKGVIAIINIIDADDVPSAAFPEVKDLVPLEMADVRIISERQSSKDERRDEADKTAPASTRPAWRPTGFLTVPTPNRQYGGLSRQNIPRNVTTARALQARRHVEEKAVRPVYLGSTWTPRSKPIGARRSVAREPVLEILSETDEDAKEEEQSLEATERDGADKAGFLTVPTPGWQHGGLSMRTDSCDITTAGRVQARRRAEAKAVRPVYHSSTWTSKDKQAGPKPSAARESALGTLTEADEDAEDQDQSVNKPEDFDIRGECSVQIITEGTTQPSEDDMVAFQRLFTAKRYEDEYDDDEDEYDDDEDKEEEEEQSSQDLDVIQACELGDIATEQLQGDHSEHDDLHILGRIGAAFGRDEDDGEMEPESAEHAAAVGTVIEAQHVYGLDFVQWHGFQALWPYPGQWHDKGKEWIFDCSTCGVPKELFMHDGRDDTIGRPVTVQVFGRDMQPASRVMHTLQASDIREVAVPLPQVCKVEFANVPADGNSMDGFVSWPLCVAGYPGAPYGWLERGILIGTRTGLEGDIDGADADEHPRVGLPRDKIDNGKKDDGKDKYDDGDGGDLNADACRVCCSGSVEDDYDWEEEIIAAYEQTDSEFIASGSSDGLTVAVVDLDSPPSVVVQSTSGAQIGALFAGDRMRHESSTIDVITPSTAGSLTAAAPERPKEASAPRRGGFWSRLFRRSSPRSSAGEDFVHGSGSERPSKDMTTAIFPAATSELPIGIVQDSYILEEDEEIARITAAEKGKGRLIEKDDEKQPEPEPAPEPISSCETVEEKIVEDEVFFAYDPDNASEFLEGDSTGFTMVSTTGYHSPPRPCVCAQAEFAPLASRARLSPARDESGLASLTANSEMKTASQLEESLSIATLNTPSAPPAAGQTHIASVYTSATATSGPVPGNPTSTSLSMLSQPTFWQRLLGRQSASASQEESLDSSVAVHRASSLSDSAGSCIMTSPASTVDDSSSSDSSSMISGNSSSMSLPLVSQSSSPVLSSFWSRIFGRRSPCPSVSACRDSVNVVPPA